MKISLHLKSSLQKLTSKEDEKEEEGSSLVTPAYENGNALSQRLRTKQVTQFPDSSPSSSAEDSDDQDYSSDEATSKKKNLQKSRNKSTSKKKATTKRVTKSTMSRPSKKQKTTAKQSHISASENGETGDEASSVSSNTEIKKAKVDVEKSEQINQDNTITLFSLGSFRNFVLARRKALQEEREKRTRKSLNSLSEEDQIQLAMKLSLIQKN